jgi:hypothetical protein
MVPIPVRTPYRTFMSIEEVLEGGMKEWFDGETKEQKACVR